MESFYGFVATPLDAAILIFASETRSGVIPIQRRLLSVERDMIRSGSIFVFSESDSGMKRWTDGMRWSKSRVEGQFLVYRRVDHRRPADDGTAHAAGAAQAHAAMDEVFQAGANAAMAIDDAPPMAPTASAASTTSSLGHALTDMNLADASAPDTPPGSALSPRSADAAQFDWTPARMMRSATASSSGTVRKRSPSPTPASGSTAVSSPADVSSPVRSDSGCSTPRRDDASPMSVKEEDANDAAARAAAEQSLPSLKRQRTLNAGNLLPPRLLRAPTMHRQMSSESVSSTASSSTTSSAAAVGDDVLCKKTFSVNVNGVVSHMICYYTKLDAISGALPIPSNCKQFANLVVPRDYVDPANFRLHPKGSAATQSLFVPPEINAAGVQIGNAIVGEHKPVPIAPAMARVLSLPVFPAPAGGSSLKRILRTRMRHERRVTLVCRGASLVDVPLPHEVQQLHSQVAQLFGLTSHQGLRIVLPGLGDINSPETFAILCTGDVLDVSAGPSSIVKPETPAAASVATAIDPATIPDLKGLSKSTAEAALALAALAGATVIETDSMCWNAGSPLGSGPIAPPSASASAN
nr:hypothetical protein HK105_007734 [Polyrhizophydium stewartii]